MQALDIVKEPVTLSFAVFVAMWALDLVKKLSTKSSNGHSSKNDSELERLRFETLEKTMSEGFRNVVAELQATRNALSAFGEKQDRARIDAVREIKEQLHKMSKVPR